ncbi:hypothetical protein [Haliscomenobacter sp.]|uniref:hypothetical protein n=1 Tax=Haliscomenobacter sp. TaxID=2717303 RepID=UPI003593C7F8
MKHFVSIFFLIIMILNAALPLVEQLQVEDLYELVEAGADDADDENKSEKESEKETEKEGEKEQELEKKSITLSAYLLIKNAAYRLEQFNRSIFPLNELPESELYTSLLELPPEA